MAKVDKKKALSVSCELGRLYNKDAILHFLLDRGKQPEETQRRLAHIKRMKDVVELQLSPNPSHRIGSKIKDTKFSG